MAEETVPVEEGQWRREYYTVWAVLKPAPRRKGFWVAVSHEGPSYRVEELGRNELERMPLVSADFFGDRGHPGVGYVESLESMMRQVGE